MKILTAFIITLLSSQASAFMVFERENLASPIEVASPTTLDLNFFKTTPKITRGSIFLELYFEGNPLEPHQGLSISYSAGDSFTAKGIQSLFDPIDYLKFDISDIYTIGDQAQLTISPPDGGANLSNIFLSAAYTIHIPLPTTLLLYLSGLALFRAIKYPLMP